MSKELILIRGLPGSGKSTFAIHLATNLNLVHFETDLFFLNENGEYKFDSSKLKEAHEWCQKNVENILFEEETWPYFYDGCVVSNTFSRVWEMQPYIDMSERYNCRLTVLECQGDYGNIHDVPEETIKKMKARWEKYPKEI